MSKQTTQTKQIEHTKKRMYNFDGITIDDMNPDNIALKNDYNHNLHSLMFNVIPFVSMAIGKVKVLKAACSQKKNKREGKISSIDIKFGECEACKLTSDNYNRDIFYNSIVPLLGSMPEIYSFILYEDYLIAFKDDNKRILEEVDNELRTLYQE